MEMEFIYGKMAENFMANGKITTWKALESIIGAMEEDLKVSTITIKNGDMAFTFGQTGEDMKDGGTKVNSMDLVPIWIQVKVKLNMVCGKMEKE
jgi:hypothetical protein